MKRMMGVPTGVQGVMSARWMSLASASVEPPRIPQENQAGKVKDKQGATNGYGSVLENLQASSSSADAAKSAETAAKSSAAARTVGGSPFLRAVPQSAVDGSNKDGSGNQEERLHVSSTTATTTGNAPNTSSSVREKIQREEPAISTAGTHTSWTFPSAASASSGAGASTLSTLLGGVRTAPTASSRPASDSSTKARFSDADREFHAKMTGYVGPTKADANANEGLAASGSEGNGSSGEEGSSRQPFSWNRSNILLACSAIGVSTLVAAHSFDEETLDKLPYPLNKPLKIVKHSSQAVLSAPSKAQEAVTEARRAREDAEQLPSVFENIRKNWENVMRDEAEARQTVITSALRDFLLLLDHLERNRLVSKGVLVRKADDPTVVVGVNVEKLANDVQFALYRGDDEKVFNLFNLRQILEFLQSSIPKEDVYKYFPAFQDIYPVLKVVELSPAQKYRTANQNNHSIQHSET
jgi:hypothetical protein